MNNLRKSLLAFLIIAYLILGSLYSVVTPIFEASDELWHYPMVKAVADSGLQLPVQNPAVPTAWRQEGSQPPLYYMIAAVFTGWIDTSDLDKVRYLNPHPDIGVVVPDGNVNMIIHNPTLESFPWHGTVLAVHLCRFLSVLLGAITVAATYLLTLELFPQQRWLAFVAGAFTAFNPMFLFISGSVNNDNLSNALGCLLLLLIVRLVKRRDASPLRDLVIIGVVTGAGMLAKFNIGFMVILVALSLAIISYRLRDWRPFVIGGLVTGGLTILIAGWWYLRNQQLYDDVTGLNMMLSIVGPRTVPANLPQLWSERQTFWMSYWGFFGGVNLPMPDWVYAVFNAIAGIAAVGLLIGAVSWAIKRTSPPSLVLKRSPFSASREREPVGVDSPRPNISYTKSVLAPLFLRLRGEKGLGDRGAVINDNERHSPFHTSSQGSRVPLIIARAFTIIWIVVLFVGLLRWTSVTWASQGRLMFSAIAPLSMWIAVGLWHVGQLLTHRGQYLPFGLSVAWGIIASIFGLLIIQQAYVAFVPFPDSYLPVDSYAFVEPGKTTPSLNVAVNPNSLDTVKVGNYLNLYEPFAAPLGSSFTHDWSIFIHLEDENGLIVAQRDVFPGQGHWATSLNLIPRYWTNYFAVSVPEFATAPHRVRVYLGLYDNRTGERMTAFKTVNFGGDSQSASAQEIYLGTVTILPRDSPLNVPNPMTVNFGDEVQLVGYDISSLTMYPKKKITVTFYWRALHPLSADYHVFSQILEPGTTRVFAGSDKQQLSTTWKPGDIIKDEHTMTVFDDAPAGTWQLQVGMYKSTTESQFDRLRIITPDGGQADDALPLTRVKIDPPLEPF